MTNLKIKTGSGADAYLSATGAGTDADPHVMEQTLADVTLTHLAGTIALSGANTVVAAPGATHRIVVDRLYLQLEAATTTTAIVLDDATARLRVRLVADGDQQSWVFERGKELKLGANMPLVVSLSGANDVGYCVAYRVESA